MNRTVVDRWAPPVYAALNFAVIIAPAVAVAAAANRGGMGSFGDGRDLLAGSVVLASIHAAVAWRRLTDEERVELERRVRSSTVEARVARRARIVLLAAEGLSNRKIGELVGMHYNQVGEWRSRFEADRLAGLLDGDRPGRPPIYDHDDVLLLVKTVTEDPPDGATRWTMEALAVRMGEHGVPISPSSPKALKRATASPCPRSRP